MSRLIIEPGSTILFQGDSITDAGRLNEGDSGMGWGYPLYISSWLSALCPAKNLKFINRGISGNRVCDLEARWTEDCIALKPDWLSILIGINDTWRRYDSNVVSDIAEFEDCYARILERTKAESSAKLILLEPFLLHTPSDRLDWREDLDPRIHAVRRVAQAFEAIYVPLDGIFAAEAVRTGPEYWAADGVHPTPAGHAKIAQEWIKAVSE